MKSAKYGNKFAFQTTNNFFQKNNLINKVIYIGKHQNLVPHSYDMITLNLS
jgi:hypothetical protein